MKNYGENGIARHNTGNILSTAEIDARAKHMTTPFDSVPMNNTIRTGEFNMGNTSGAINRDTRSIGMVRVGATGVKLQQPSYHNRYPHLHAIPYIDFQQPPLSNFTFNVPNRSPNNRTPPENSFWTNERDKHMAQKQERIDSLPPNERREQHQWAKQQCNDRGLCPCGWEWSRVPGGYRCAGATGIHMTTDRLLAEGKSGFLMRSGVRFERSGGGGQRVVDGEGVEWVGPMYRPQRDEMEMEIWRKHMARKNRRGKRWWRR